MISPELQSQIQTWRQKAAAGTLSIEEMRDAVAAMRGSRLSAAEAAAKSPSRSRAKSPTRSADDMLKDLGGL